MIKYLKRRSDGFGIVVNMRHVMIIERHPKGDGSILTMAHGGFSDGPEFIPMQVHVAEMPDYFMQ